MNMLNWRDTCKFLSGVAFASCAMNFYFFLCQTTIPFLNSVVVDDSLAMKVAVLSGLFVALFYLGFCTQVQQKVEPTFQVETARPSGVASLTASTEHVA